MGNPTLPRELTALSDDELRDLFQRTIEDSNCIEVHFATEWRQWLVRLLLQYFAGQYPQTFTDRCRYVAFALRYLTAIEIGAGEPIKVRLVMTVMESRPAVVARLLFGSVEERQEALQTAYAPSMDGNDLPTDSYQRAVIEEYVQKFSERKPANGSPAYDESTIARWSRDLIPELERVVLDRIKPARRMAQDRVIQKMVVNPQADTNGSDRARLVAYLEEFEQGSLSSHYGVALAALNDYDRRIENDGRQFKSQRRLFGVLVLLIGVAAGAVLLSLWPILPDWSRGLALLAAFCTGMGMVVALLHLFVRIVVGTVTLTEHISRTRTDIQTLQQLVDRARQ